MKREIRVRESCFMRSEYLPMKKNLRCARTVGVLAKGGKVLDDLAEMGYVIPELASWVGPASTQATP